jgi:hypothetical protein
MGADDAALNLRGNNEGTSVSNIVIAGKTFNNFYLL